MRGPVEHIVRQARAHRQAGRGHQLQPPRLVRAVEAAQHPVQGVAVSSRHEQGVAVSPHHEPAVEVAAEAAAM
jgi:hypothetical protein